MKLKSSKSKHILRLHLLKSKTYENFIKKTSSEPAVNSSLTQTLLNFKKSLQIIFKYHRIKKRILFVGLPKGLEAKVNSLTHHVAVPKEFNLQGVISNNNLASSKVKKNYFHKTLLPKLKKKPHLIVIHSINNKKIIIAESLTAKIPVISLYDAYACNIKKENEQCINSDLERFSSNDIFFIGLNFLFKSSNRK